jgi:hypothetical protein
VEVFEMKKILVVLVLVIVAIIVIWLGSREQPILAGQTQPVTQLPAQPTQEHIHVHEYAVTGRVPAYYATAPDVATLPPILSPQLFTGNIRLAYQAAKEIPQTLAQLPCYCHCDRGHNHKSLHSCFESEHGENCGICIGEALMAHGLQKRWMAVTEIRKQIIAAYGNN